MTTKDSKLKAQQERFINEYLIDMNATQAAIRAGYSAKSAYSQGQRLLKKDEVDKAIQSKLKSINKATIATAEEVLEYLSKAMRGEIQEECIVVEGQGNGFSEAVKRNKTISPRDRKKAGELLSKRYGLLVENHNINAELAVQIVDDIDA